MRQIILQVDEQQYQKIQELAGESNIEQFILNNTINNKCWLMLESSFNNLRSMRIILKENDFRSLEFLAYQRGITVQQYLITLILAELEFNKEVL